MGHDQRGGSGATVGVVIALIAVAVLAVPCLLGAFLLLGLYSFRATAMPAPPTVTTLPMPMTTPPMVQPMPAVPPPLTQPISEQSETEVTPSPEKSPAEESSPAAKPDE